MKKTIRDYDLSGKKVLIRCDFNVPIKDGKIVDDNRIKESLKTIEYAIEHQAKVILFSHLGRVKTLEDCEKNNLYPVAQRLSNLLNRPVKFSQKTRGKELEEAINELQNQEILLVQNTRYEDLDGKKESTNDSELGTYWASLGDLFINDAFGTAHRAHASNVGIASHLPNGIGFLMEKELLSLESLKTAEHLFTVILGGAKVKDKIGVIENLVKQVDYLLIGGGMVFTFLKAKGYQVGTSIVDEENISFCQKILSEYPEKVILPLDVHVTTEFNNDAESHIAKIIEIKENEMGMDLGPETIQLYEKYILSSKTILWNGPLGVYEMEKYQTATKEVLNTISKSNAYSVLGGGDIVAAATQLGYKEKVSHASTGGGATLEYLEGKELPGIAIIQEGE